MVVTLWRWRHRCRAAVGIQALRRGPARILRYRIVGCDLLRYAALRLTVRQRRHGRTPAAARNRRFHVVVAPAEADIGEALQQGHSFLRVIVLGNLGTDLRINPVPPGVSPIVSSGPPDF